jgi:hypothetical protein
VVEAAADQERTNLAVAGTKVLLLELEEETSQAQADYSSLLLELRDLREEGGIVGVNVNDYAVYKRVLFDYSVFDELAVM